MSVKVLKYPGSKWNIALRLADFNADSASSLPVVRNPCPCQHWIKNPAARWYLLACPEKYEKNCCSYISLEYGVVITSLGEEADARYPITLLWANEHGEHLVTQAAFPAGKI